MHLAAIGYRLVLFPVGSKTYTTMEKHLKVGPNVVDTVHPLTPHHLFQHRKKPRRHAGNVGDMLAAARLDECRQLLVPHFHKRHFLRRHPQQVDNWVDVVDKVRREVAHDHAVLMQLVGKAASENECAAVENTAFGIQVEIERHAVGTAAVMTPCEGFFRNRYVFAFSVRRSRRLRIIAHAPFPQHAALAADHPHHQRAYVLVAHKRHCLLIVLITANFGETVFSSVFCRGCLLKQREKLPFLYFLCIISKPGALCHPPQKKRSCQLRNPRHIAVSATSVLRIPRR